MVVAKPQSRLDEGEAGSRDREQQPRAEGARQKPESGIAITSAIR